MDNNETCKHHWHVVAVEKVLSHYSPYDPDDDWMELDGSETIELLGIRSITCDDCGESAPPDVVKKIKEQLS